MVPVISNLFLIRISILVFVLSFIVMPEVKAQTLSETNGNCLVLWDSIRVRDTHRAYQYFLTQCKEKRYANIAEIKIKVIKNRCNSAWELYDITKERKYLEKYRDSCKEFDDEKMKKVLALINETPKNFSALHQIKNIKIDQNILFTIIILIISIFFIWREIRKDNL